MVAAMEEKFVRLDQFRSRWRFVGVGDFTWYYVAKSYYG
jgi:hypothetical protein